MATPPIAVEHGDPPLVERVIAFVEVHFASPISLRHVADAFGYSACHLTTTFRQATGTPLTAWIIQRRILAAQELLGEGGMNVAEACEAVGFTDPCYFTRQFTRYVGTTPGRFRAACRTHKRPGAVIPKRSGGLSIDEVMNERGRYVRSVLEQEVSAIAGGAAWAWALRGRPGFTPLPRGAGERRLNAETHA